MERNCLECGRKLLGRTDQKFCNDHCRNTFNNRLNRDENKYMKQIGRILRKNRRILKEFHPNGHTRARKQELQSLGFDFSFYTNIDKAAHGRKCFFCYDYGYVPLKNDYFAIVKNKAP